MNVPAGYTVRHANLADAPAVTELIRAAELVDLGEPMVELADVEADWQRPSIDVEADVRLLLDEEGRLVGAAQVSEERADVDVHPDARGRGLGTALIAWSEQRAREQAAISGVPARVGQTLKSDLDGVDLLRSRGYEKLWDSWILRLADDVDAAAPLPTGVEIREFRPDEEHSVYKVIDDAFSEWEGREPRSFEDFQSQVTKRPDFDPTLLLVATADDELVGAAFGINYPDEGWIDKIAVKSSHRGRGIATALLTSMFAEFRARNITCVRLNTDSRTGALDLYLRLGMFVEQSFTRWSVALD